MDIEGVFCPFKFNFLRDSSQSISNRLATNQSNDYYHRKTICQADLNQNENTNLCSFYFESFHILLISIKSNKNQMEQKIIYFGFCINKIKIRLIVNTRTNMCCLLVQLLILKWYLLNKQFCKWFQRRKLLKTIGYNQKKLRGSLMFMKVKRSPGN